jgi:hypothetical protein
MEIKQWSTVLVPRQTGNDAQGETLKCRVGAVPRRNPRGDPDIHIYVEEL